MTVCSDVGLSNPPSYRVFVGDCIEQMRHLGGQSINCVVTSPPYFGLRDYGHEGQIGAEDTPDAYVARLVEVFREVRRVLRDDGTVWLNLGDSYAAARGGTHMPDQTVAGGHGGKGDDASFRGMGGENRGSAHRNASAIGLKHKDLIGIPWRVAFALQADGWYLRQDIIWCLSGGTRVYARTQKGEMPMMIKDMIRLDPATVQLWNGEKWTQVLGWSETPRPDRAFEIELRSGQRVGCTAGHLWPTQRGNARADELMLGDVIETCRLPEPEQPDQPKAIGDKFGHFVGLYLAEGSLDSRGRVQLAGHASEHDQRMSALGYLTDDFGAGVRGYVTGNKSHIVVDSPAVTSLLRLFVHGGYARDKGLKVAAWRRSDNFLRCMLEGYLSGDGHYDEKNDRYRLTFTRNDRLAADLRTLCARLGLPLRLAVGTASGFGKAWPIYRGSLRLTPTTYHTARKDGEVVAIRASRARKFWDIAVADEPHLFALASGVLTHNSKPNPMPESVRDRCTKAHEYVFLLSKGSRYYFDAEAIKEDATGRPPGNKKATKSGRAHEAGDDRHRTSAGLHNIGAVERRNRRSVWTVTAKPYKGAHFATFPPDLIEPCVLAGCPEGGIVLDPFGGSGTTAGVALKHGRNAVLCELNEEYATLVPDRVRNICGAS